MTITLIAPPLSQIDAERLGQALCQYKITVSRLSVVNVWDDGSRHTNDAATRTIREAAGATGLGFALAPAAVPLMGLIPAISLPAVLIALAANLAALFQTNKRTVDRRAVRSEITLAFGDVSPKRAAWSEYLIGAYCALHGWYPAAPTRSTQSGAAYAARQRQMPPAWSAR